MWTGPKFESDLLKTNKDVGSSAKSRNFTDVYVMGRGGGASLPPPPPKTFLSDAPLLFINDLQKTLDHR